MNKYISALLLSGLLLNVSCSPSHDEAQARLNAARELYGQGNYEQAKLEIDSIAILYSKSFEQRKQGLLLLDSVRYTENYQTIRICDSLLAINAPRIDSMKKLFIFHKDKNYQETGFYQPKETASNSGLTNTTLRSAIGEDGSMYLESVFAGGTKHNRIKVSVSGGESIESATVTDDGLNYRFTVLGKTFEVIRFAGKADNGIAKLISENPSKSISVSVEGGGRNSYTLSAALKNAIGKSYRLSQLMLHSDSLSTKMEETEFKLKYLDNKEEIQKINRELKESDQILEHTQSSK